MSRIQVGVRLRPLLDEKTSSPGISVNTATNSLEVSASGMKYEFQFDTLFHESSSQSDVFERCAVPIIRSAVDGYNGCIFAFGQTGSGYLTYIACYKHETYL